MKELKSSLDTIRKTASELITGVEGALQELQLNRALEQEQGKESILLIQNDELTEFSIVNVRGMDTQELVAALSEMSSDDKLSIQAYLESRGAWTTELGNEQTSEFEENAINGMEEQNYNMVDNVLNNGAGEKTQKEENKKEQECPAARTSLKARLAEKKAQVSGQGQDHEAQENAKKNQREM
jgi:hypothetical protein